MTSANAQAGRRPKARAFGDVADETTKTIREAETARETVIKRIAEAEKTLREYRGLRAKLSRAINQLKGDGYRGR